MQWRLDNNFLAVWQYTGSSWASTSIPISLYHQGTFVESRIALSDLGSPTSLHIATFLANAQSGSEWTYAGMPDNSFTDGFDRDVGHSLLADFNSSNPPNMIPEPCTAVLLGTISAAFGGYFWRRRKMILQAKEFQNSSPVNQAPLEH